MTFEIIMIGFVVFIIVAVYPLVRMIETSVYIRTQGEIYDNLNKQVELVNSVLNLIDNQIAIEVAHCLKEEISLDKSYNPINIDKDVAKIANKVFSTINKELITLLSNEDAIYTNDFWMNYIVEKTSLSILASTKAIRK